jgi:hypothetical protein
LAVLPSIDFVLVFLGRKLTILHLKDVKSYYDSRTEISCPKHPPAHPPVVPGVALVSRLADWPETLAISVELLKKRRAIVNLMRCALASSQPFMVYNTLWLLNIAMV